MGDRAMVLNGSGTTSGIGSRDYHHEDSVLVGFPTHFEAPLWVVHLKEAY